MRLRYFEKSIIVSSVHISQISRHLQTFQNPILNATNVSQKQKIRRNGLIYVSTAYSVYRLKKLVSGSKPEGKLSHTFWKSLKISVVAIVGHFSVSVRISAN